MRLNGEDAGLRPGDRSARLLGRRLAQLLPSLAAEFGDAKPAEEIRACADAILAEFDDVPVRS